MSERSDDADSLLRAVAAAPARSPALATRLAEGAVVDGRFVVVAFLGEAGASLTYQATDKQNGATVLLEAARARWADGEPVARELERVQALSHPALARTVARGTLPDGSAFVVTERQDGATLAAHLATHGALPIGDCLLLARRLADALAALHAAGIVHGDVEPANVYLSDGELLRAKLTGATNARLQPRPRMIARATTSGEHACYAAPEVARGVSDVDARADVFALGCVLFECLTGRSPFSGATEAAAVAKLVVERAPRVRAHRADVPAALDGLLAAMLERDRQNRPGDGGELVRALALLSDGLGHTDRGLAAGAIAPGLVLLDRYEVTRELGRGGMGRVFAARDRRLDRSVAIKVLVGESTDSRAFSRLEQEARAASRVNHPNIATVHDVLATHQGPCIVSELLEGATLRDQLAGGALSVDVVRALGAQLAAGLAAAHERGVLHRDLKPANIFVTTDRRLKILDFGLAKFLEPDPNAPSTEEGAVLGTLGYMAPEQVRGERADARSDLFSAGIVLYEALVGRRPFEGASRYEIESCILQRAPAPLPADIPAELAATVLRCLEKNPALRFQSARELGAALAESSSPSPSSSTKRANRRRHLAIRPLVAPATLVVLLAAAGVVWLGRSPAPSASAPSAPPSVAVLPFRDLSPDKDQQFLSDGIAGEILTSLARVEGVRVTGLTSSFSFRDSHDDARTIGQKLGVGALVEGSVWRAGERVRISARLVSAVDGFQLWGEDFDRQTSDLAFVEDEVTSNIVRALRVKLLPGEHASTGLEYRDPKAYEEYLLAKRQADGAGTADDLATARRSIERALDLDPRFGLAWAQYATILFHTVFTDIDRRSSDATARRAAEAADRAIALEPDRPEGYLARSAIRSDLGSWDLKGAVADLERAAALSPNDIRVIEHKAHLLLYFSHRVDEAIALYRRAIEIDPLNDGAWFMLGYGYRETRRFDEERRALNRALEIAPKNGIAQAFLAELELHDGHLDKALALFDANPERVCRLLGRAWVLDRMHRVAESRAAIASLLVTDADENPYFVASAYAYTGDLDHAFAYYERAFAHRDVALIDIAASPWLDDVRRDPRYPPLLRKMGLLDEPAPAAPASIAVLPFRDLSPEHSQQYLADGMAEEILTSLARGGGLHVAGRTSSFSFRNTTDDARTIAQKLGVAALVEGSVQKAGKRVRVSVRLVNADDGYQLWAQDFDRSTGDILAVEEELARAIAAALKVKLTPAGGAQATSRGWSDPQDYADYLLARHRLKTGEDAHGVLPLIERVVARNPQSAAAWALDAEALLAVTYSASVKTHAESMRWSARSLEAADRAIALDPELPDGYIRRAMVRGFGLGWDFAGARADLDRALALAPNDTDALSVRARLLLYFSSRTEEVIADLKRVTELDPLDDAGWGLLGEAYRAERRFGDMKAALRRAIDINPKSPGCHALLAEYELRTGSPEKALRMYEAIPGADDSYRLLGEVKALAALKRTGEARTALRELEAKWGEYYYAIAEGYLALGDRDRFWSYCDRALQDREHVLAELVISPFMDEARRDPRYSAFLQRMNLLDAH